MRVWTWNGKYPTTTNMPHDLSSGTLGRYQWLSITFLVFEPIFHLRILPSVGTYPISNIGIPGKDIIGVQRRKQSAPSRGTSQREWALFSLDRQFSGIPFLVTPTSNDNNLVYLSVHTLTITLNIHFICNYTIIICTLLILLIKSLSSSWFTINNKKTIISKGTRK